MSTRYLSYEDKLFRECGRECKIQINFSWFGRFAAFFVVIFLLRLRPFYLRLRRLKSIFLFLHETFGRIKNASSDNITKSPSPETTQAS